MGERKGQNFYYPPDFDPQKHGSLNGYHGVHALRERARKLDRGILIIRFEMPYNIWCGGCKKHIGMGVRYNAEKTKVGMYYTTPIYQFRMKCHLCTNHFSIKTDPANLDYIIVEGATRQERRWDPSENGQIVPDDKSVGKKLADDAMFKLEHENKDRGKSLDSDPRLVEISDIQDRVRDDYLANRILRDKFRKKKKALKAKQNEDKELLSRTGLDIKLVGECPEDVKLARLLSYQAKSGAEKLMQESRSAVLKQDIFQTEQNKNRLSCRKDVKKSDIFSNSGQGFDTLVKRRSKSTTNLNELVKQVKKTDVQSDVLTRCEATPNNEKEKTGTASLSLLSNYADSSDED